MAAKRKTCALIGFALAVALITPRAAIAGLADPRTQLGAAAALETRAAPTTDRAQEIAVDVDAAAEQQRAEAAHGLHTIAPSDAHLGPKTRVMGSDVPAEIRIWAETKLTLRTHWGFGYVYGEIASGYVLGAGGGQMFAGPGAAVGRAGWGPSMSVPPVGQPGSRFSNTDAAALDALRQVLVRGRETGFEYSSTLYGYRGGFEYTPTRTDLQRLWVFPPITPVFTVNAGDAHYHNDVAYPGENPFSNDDMGAMWKTRMPQYMVDPTGQTWKGWYDPSGLNHYPFVPGPVLPLVPIPYPFW